VNNQRLTGLVIAALCDIACVSGTLRLATGTEVDILSAAASYEAQSLAELEISPNVVLDATPERGFGERPALTFHALITPDGASVATTSTAPFVVGVGEFPSLPHAQERLFIRAVQPPAGTALYSNRAFNHAWPKHRERLSFHRDPTWHGFVIIMSPPHLSVSGARAIVRITTVNPRNDCGSSQLVLLERALSAWRVTAIGDEIVAW
jgi:hypothetical protein